MKYSLVVLASLLAIVSNASPMPKEVNIHLDIKVEDSTQNAAAQRKVAFQKFSIDDVCWSRVCFPNTTPCPPNWYSKLIGSCWTCCGPSSQIDGFVAPKSEKTQYVIDAAPSRPSKELFTIQDSCLDDFCYPQEFTCPTGWYSKSGGGCWTCCKSSSQINDLAAAEL